MVKDVIFGVVGGLGLFLFGMGLMSNGLKDIAGQKLKTILGSLTKHRVIAVLVGTSVTGLIQSSSAVTVMIVGFVNAGLLTLKQALCVVLGANIGTTCTAWIVSAFGIGGLKITAYALPAIGAGFLLQITGKTRGFRGIGSLILGLGLLFIGIGFMESAFDPLKNSVRVQESLIWLGRNPILAVLAGTLLTMLIQSSSASIMIIQVLAFQGAFGTDWDLVLRVTIPFILGDNIGTTITAQLAALQTSRNSKRAAMGHTVFNVIGVIYMFPLVWMGLFGKMVSFLTPWHLSQTTIMAEMACAHSLFNIFNTIVFLPGIGVLEKIVLQILPVTQRELDEKPVVLETHLLNTPVLAMDQARREIVRMVQTAKDAINYAIDGLINDDRRKLETARTTEDITDHFQYEITSYLTLLSTKELSKELSAELPVLLHTVNDLERIGDHAVNITEIAERKIEQKLRFSEYAETDVDQLQKEVNQMFARIITALENNDKEAAKAALVNENALNKMQVDFRRNHVQRMANGISTAAKGLIFIDIVDNVEKVGDHLTNIAQSVIGGFQWDDAETKTYPPS